MRKKKIKFLNELFNITTIVRFKNYKILKISFLIILVCLSFLGCINESKPQNEKYQNRINSKKEKPISSNKEIKSKDTGKTVFSNNKDFQKTSLKSGLNVKSFCNKCNKDIIINLNFDSNKYNNKRYLHKNAFDIGHIAHKISCPICKTKLNIQNIKTFYIYNCNYEYEGVTNTGRKKKLKGITKDYIEIPFKNDKSQTIWNSLILYVYSNELKNLQANPNPESLFINKNNSKEIKKAPNIDSKVNKEIKSEETEKTGNTNKKIENENKDFLKIHLKSGLNVKSFCNRCNKDIFINLNFDSKKYDNKQYLPKNAFDIGHIIHKIPCPICKTKLNILKLKKLYIYNCNYEYEGIINTGKEKKLKGITKDYIEIPFKNDKGQIIWNSLIIYVQPNSLDDIDNNQFQNPNSKYNKSIEYLKHGISLKTFCNKCNKNTIISLGLNAKKYDDREIALKNVFDIPHIMHKISCPKCKTKIYSKNIIEFYICKCSYRYETITNEGEEKHISGIAKYCKKIPFKDDNKTILSSLIISIKPLQR